ncbi:MAG: hypothetical protein GY785_02860 [Gammaproteobacteria bacterium]|nr:hypothetical protein [Gammaproteobacteria bacterium]
MQGGTDYPLTNSGLTITWENSATGKSGVGSIATRTVTPEYGSGVITETSWSFPFIDLSIGDNPIVITISHSDGVYASTVLMVERRADVEDATIELSGAFSDDSAPIEHALVTPFAIGKPDVPMFAKRHGYRWELYDKRIQGYSCIT